MGYLEIGVGGPVAAREIAHLLDELNAYKAELAALEAVAEAARKHIVWCDVRGATIEDALNKLDELKDIARTAGESR